MGQVARTFSEYGVDRYVRAPMLLAFVRVGRSCEKTQIDPIRTVSLLHHCSSAASLQQREAPPTNALL